MDTFEVNDEKKADPSRVYKIFYFIGTLKQNHYVQTTVHTSDTTTWMSSENEAPRALEAEMNEVYTNTIKDSINQCAQAAEYFNGDTTRESSETEVERSVVAEMSEVVPLD